MLCLPLSYECKRFGMPWSKCPVSKRFVLIVALLTLIEVWADVKDISAAGANDLLARYGI